MLREYARAYITMAARGPHRFLQFLAHIFQIDRMFVVDKVARLDVA
jgi:hypothetical protein